jgi:hypothetical protein
VFAVHCFNNTHLPLVFVALLLEVQSELLSALTEHVDTLDALLGRLIPVLRHPLAKVEIIPLRRSGRREALFSRLTNQKEGVAVIGS